MALDTETAGLQLTFDDIVDKIQTTDETFPWDYRLTAWDRFAHGPLWIRLAAAALWVLSTALGWRRLSSSPS